MISLIIAGGSGSRLWPLSNNKQPKQFLTFQGTSLLRATYSRTKQKQPTWFVTHKRWVTKTKNELKLTRNNAVILGEPVGKNTAPAIALACHFMLKKGLGQEVVGVYPADHHIRSAQAFRKSMREAEKHALKNKVVTFGVRPTRPETSYGYIEINTQLAPRNDQAQSVVKFVEKPSVNRAQVFYQSKKFLWNSGIFVAKVEVLAELFKKYQPQLWGQISKMSSPQQMTLKKYQRLSAISFDHAIMEHLKKDLLCIPVHWGWSDLGTWDEWARATNQDEKFFLYVKGGGGHFVSTDRKRLVALVDVEDLIIIEYKNILYVTRRGQKQDIKAMLLELKKKKNLKPFMKGY